MWNRQRFVIDATEINGSPSIQIVKRSKALHNNNKQRSFAESDDREEGEGHYFFIISKYDAIWRGAGTCARGGALPNQNGTW